MWCVSMEKVAELHFLRFSIFRIQIILVSFQRFRNWHNLFFGVPHLKICILANLLMLFSTQVFKVVSHNFCIKVVAWMQGANGLSTASTVSFSPRGQQKRRPRVTCDEAQGTTERRMAKRVRLGANLYRERDVWVRGTAGGRANNR